MNAKRNKLIKICGIAVCLFLLFPFGGCVDKSKIWFKTGYEGVRPSSYYYSLYEGEDERETINLPLIICTADELETACDKEYYYVEKESNENSLSVNVIMYMPNPDDYERAYYLRELTKGYNEEFFNNYALVLHEFSILGNRVPELKSVKVKSEILTLNYLNSWESGTTTNTCEWFFIVEIKQGDVTGDTKIDVQIKEKKPSVYYVSNKS